MKTSITKPLVYSNSSSYSYAYHELRKLLISDSDSDELIQELREKYEATNHIEAISFEDVTKYLREDLLPFFESIFNFDLFNTYMNSNDIHEPSICNVLCKEFINFIHKESNNIMNTLEQFSNGNQNFYDLFIAVENSLVKKVFLFVFQNTRFTGADKKYVLNTDANRFIKEYLTSILIQIREQPKAVSSRLLQLEINRVQTLILKNANFNFLNWYLNELKSVLKDLKFIHDKQPNYGLSCEEIVLRRLYRELKKEDFIDIDHTTEVNFVDVFLKEWYTHDSICVLKMDNPQTKYFLDQFKVHIDASLKVSDIEKVKNISNKNGYIRSASLSASSSRNKVIGPKRDRELAALFVKS